MEVTLKQVLDFLDNVSLPGLTDVELYDLGSLTSIIASSCTMEKQRREEEEKEIIATTPVMVLTTAGSKLKEA